MAKPRKQIKDDNAKPKGPFVPVNTTVFNLDEVTTPTEEPMPPYYRLEKIDTYTWQLLKYENGVVDVVKSGLLMACFHVFKTIVLRGDK